MQDEAINCFVAAASSASGLLDGGDHVWHANSLQPASDCTNGFIEVPSDDVWLARAGEVLFCFFPNCFTSRLLVHRVAIDAHGSDTTDFAVAKGDCCQVAVEDVVIGLHLKMRSPHDGHTTSGIIIAPFALAVLFLILSAVSDFCRGPHFTPPSGLDDAMFHVFL